MNWQTLGVMIAVWLFQAGVIYAGFLALKSQALATLAWQKDHADKDDARFAKNDRRFMLMVGMVAAMVEDSKKDKVLDLIKEFSHD